MQGLLRQYGTKNQFEQLTSRLNKDKVNLPEVTHHRPTHYCNSKYITVVIAIEVKLFIHSIYYLKESLASPSEELMGLKQLRVKPETSDSVIQVSAHPIMI